MKFDSYSVERRKRTKERIEQINSLPNFLTVASFKKEEDKAFLEELANHREEREIREDGTMVIKENGKIKEVTTVFAYCQKMVKEMNGNGTNDSS